MIAQKHREDDNASNERLVRYELYRERMLHGAGLRSKFQRMRKWHKHCVHDESRRRKTMKYLISQSSFLPYSNQTISQHLSRTHSWMRNPGRNSFYHGIAVIRKELDNMWLNERRLLSGCCCNIMTMLFCLRVMSEIERSAEKLVKKYRAQQEFWPVCVESVECNESQLVESVDFSKDPSQIGVYLDHVRSTHAIYRQHIRREKDTIHLFAERTMKWRKNAGGKLFKKLEKQYEGYLNCIVNSSASILPGIPEARTMKRLWKLKEIFQRRFRCVLAGWPSKMEKALLWLLNFLFKEYVVTVGHSHSGLFFITTSYPNRDRRVDPFTSYVLTLKLIRSDISNKNFKFGSIYIA
ncbi:DDB1- and CUL4-associated factor 12-B [Dirofilaria immitis]